ncbi:wax ester/triacylglycerol synthase domain-containing protein [Nocardia sp. NPDC050697]|uniref:wax ester/triacylglycerol synthase domain-containing protein n=1 Tax=Nocardia sp. NPDC050697 TaxID=3155158 RepID=UPI0033C73C2F
MTLRFSALDEFFLQIETEHRPTHWTVVIELAPEAERAADIEPIALGPLSARMRERIERYRLFRLGAGDGRFGGAVLREYDVPTAMTCVDSAAVADDAEWHELMSALLARPLPRNRPAWRAVLVDQARPARQRLVILGSHAVSDGIAAAAFAALFADGDEERLRQLDRYLDAPRYPGPRVTAREFVRSATAFGGAWSKATRSRRLPRLTANARRAMAAVELPTARVRRAAVGHGAGTAEFLIAAVGAAVADAARTVLPADEMPRTLRAFLPATFDRDLRHSGNAVSMVLINAAGPEAALADRVEATRAQLGAVLDARAEVALPVLARFGRWLPWRARGAAARAALAALAPDLHVGVSPAYVNLKTVLGNEFTAIHTLSPLLGNALSFTCLVLGGTVYIGIVWDPDACGDKIGVTAAQLLTDYVEAGVVS